jgi:hypothetical protein
MHAATGKAATAADDALRKSRRLIWAIRWFLCSAFEGATVECENSPEKGSGENGRK